MAIIKQRLIYIGIAIVLILVLSLYFFIDPSKAGLFPKCPFLSLTGLYCPGCGIQRAIHDILNGQILTGIRHNYLLLLVGAVLIYQIWILIKQQRTNESSSNLLHKASVTKFILFLVLAFWALRNLPYFPFTELAP